MIYCGGHGPHENSTNVGMYCRGGMYKKANYVVCKWLCPLLSDDAIDHCKYDL